MMFFHGNCLKSKNPSKSATSHVAETFGALDIPGQGIFYEIAKH